MEDKYFKVIDYDTGAKYLAKVSYTEKGVRAYILYTMGKNWQQPKKRLKQKLINAAWEWWRDDARKEVEQYETSIYKGR